MVELDAICRPIASELRATARAVSRSLGAAAALSGCRPGAAPDNGGKMLRPALLLLVARLFKADAGLAVRLASAIELVHAASLIHDDVIDAADTRRAARALLGAADAVLLGDVIFTGAFADLVSLGDYRMTADIARAAGDICAGEVRQNRSKGTFAVSHAAYLRTVGLKTASLYRSCAVLAALAGRAPRAQVLSAARLGAHFGLSFQITDDLLDLTGDPAKTGKPNGCDLAQGKTTLPLILYFRMIGPSRSRLLRRSLVLGDCDARARLLCELARPRVTNAVRAAAKRHSRLAVSELARLPRARETANLTALCRFAVERSY